MPAPKTVRSRRSSLPMVAFSVMAIALSAAALFEVIRAYHIRSPRKRSTVELAHSHTPHAWAPEPPWLRFHLNTIHMHESQRRHLLDGHFTIVTRMDDIPQPCKDIFDSSFVTSTGSPAPKGLVKLADPGQSFQWSDVHVEGLLLRRLAFAGLGTRSCFVHYEMGGGPGLPVGCLAIIDYGQKKTLWVGESRETTKSLKALRDIFALGYFKDTYGPVC